MKGEPTMTVYDWITAISNKAEAEHVRIDLGSKSIFYSARPIVVKDRLMTPIAVIPQDPAIVVKLDGLIAFDDDPYMEIERLYAQFKRSVPSKRDRLNKGFFKAVSSDQLSYQELESNMPRQEALLRLEGFLLLTASAGLLQWKNPNHFYWQGSDPDLILYRDWII